MFRLFRKQHEEKFLSSFSKLGLDGLSDAVACAKYHVLSNGMGGVAVEYARIRHPASVRLPAGCMPALLFAEFRWKLAGASYTLVYAEWRQS